MNTSLLTISLLIAFASPGMATGSPAVSLQQQKIELGKELGKYNFSVYASRPMNSDMSHIKHVVILQHGLQRNGLDYFNAGMKLMAASSINTDKMLLIAPDFLQPRTSKQKCCKGFPSGRFWDGQAVIFPSALLI